MALLSLRHPSLNLMTLLSLQRPFQIRHNILPCPQKFKALVAYMSKLVAYMSKIVAYMSKIVV
jgi:hypothetical protein